MSDPSKLLQGEKSLERTNIFLLQQRLKYTKKCYTCGALRISWPLPLCSDESKLQLTLEKHGFEQHGSTYTHSFSIASKYYTIRN